MRVLLMTLLVLISTDAALAQNDRLLVKVFHGGDDIVGRQLVFEFKEALRRSAKFDLAGGNDVSIIEVVVLTLPLNPQAASNAAAYAVSWTLVLDTEPLPYHIDSKLGTCGVDRVESCARTILADTDRVLEDTAARLGW